MTLKLPQNIDIEKLVISGMLNDEECFYDGVSYLEEDYFTITETINLFKKLKEDKEMQSAQLLASKTNNDQFKAVIREIDSLWSGLDDYKSAVVELKKIHNKRKLYYSLQTVMSKFDSIEPTQAAEEIYTSVMSSDLETSNTDILDPKELAVNFLSDLYERVSDPDGAMGVPFSITNNRGMSIGLPSLDEVFNGAQGGDLIMVAAKTGVGKTAFAINLARIFSIHQNYLGYYANTEMSEREMLARLLSPIANTKATEILSARYEGTQREIDMKLNQTTEAVQRFGESNLIFSRIAYLPLYKLTGLARQIKRMYGKLDYLIVDYVGRMEVDHNKNLWDELYRITKGLKQLAVELDIPVFMLAQRNEDGYIEGAKKMRNECDGVLLVEPVTTSDEEYIDRAIDSYDAPKVNYRIVKDKVRRNDNSTPIYCIFDKSKGVFQEARRK